MTATTLRHQAALGFTQDEVGAEDDANAETFQVELRQGGAEMIVDTLSLRNFRLFSEVTIKFTDRLSVVVGANGSGKSTVLDAIARLLSCYIGGFDGYGVNMIAQSDIRHVTY